MKEHSSPIPFQSEQIRSTGKRLSCTNLALQKMPRNKEKSLKELQLEKRNPVYCPVPGYLGEMCWGGGLFVQINAHSWQWNANYAEGLETDPSAELRPEQGKDAARLWGGNSRSFLATWRVSQACLTFLITLM